MFYWTKILWDFDEECGIRSDSDFIGKYISCRVLVQARCLSKVRSELFVVANQYNPIIPEIKGLIPCKWINLLNPAPASKVSHLPAGHSHHPYFTKTMQMRMTTTSSSFENALLTTWHCRNWKSCQKEVQALKACNERRKNG
ncbi:uncharacterized protein LOC142519251 isoform X1 [Primulina tabacum]|uniref:uncharacterized protein LOC142519251 isoform X1 n=1 Tax=Primulina tabacum TaxID=48773 RepID=UPI003F5AB3EB